MHVDYIIVGQGISGTFLSWNLIKAGKTVVVIDEWQPNTASRVASGIINPVTGRRVVRTWMIEELLPFAKHAYEELGNDLGIEAAREIDMLTFHTTEQMSSAWHERIAEGEDYLHVVNNRQDYEPFFELRNGIGVTSPCMLVNLSVLLPAWRNYLAETNRLLTERFDINDCYVKENSVQYNDITAEKLILCNGIKGFENRYFEKLPYAFSKGEAILVDIPGLQATNIYKQGMNLVPIGGSVFWIGSSFEWEFADDNTTESFKKTVIDLLGSWLKLPFTILEHKASIRPASLERRPFVGLHPIHSSIGIFNGMGTKGCSLAPYFSNEFAQHLTAHKSIHPSADILRFKKILSA